MVNFLPYMLIFECSGRVLFQVELTGDGKFGFDAELIQLNVGTCIKQAQCPVDELDGITKDQIMWGNEKRENKMLRVNSGRCRAKIYNTSVVDWAENTDRSFIGQVNLRGIGGDKPIIPALQACLDKITRYEAGRCGS